MYLKKGFFVILGLLSVFLGTLGIFLPLLPTVPFILLAVFCFARSSGRLHFWLVNHPWFAVAIADWERERGIRRRIKKRAMILSAVSFLISIMIVPLFWVKGLLVVMMLILLTCLWRLPTLPDSE